MKLERWALIAEITGGLAIVISLVFVTIELRESNRQAEANAGIQISELMSDWAFNLGAGSDSARIYFKGLEDFAALSSEEKSQFQYLMISFYSALSGAVRARDLILRGGDRSAIEAGTGNLQSIVRSVVNRPGYKQWLDSEYKIDPPNGLEPTLLYFMDNSVR